MKRFVSIFLRLLISGVLLVLLFREHDLFADIVPRLRALLTNWPWTLAGVTFAFLTLFLTAVRWHIILRGQVPDLPFSIVMRTEIISAFFNISSVGVVGGDTYKIMSLSRRLPGQTMPVSVSLVLDHLTGLISVAFLFSVCMMARASHWNEVGPDLRMLITGYAMYVGGALVGLFLSWLSFKPSLLAWGLRTFPRTMGNPRLAALIARLTRVHEVFERLWKRTLSAMVVSIGMHVTFFMSFYCGLRAVGGAAPVLDVLTAMPIVDAAASLPVSISGLGVRERTFEALLAGLANVPEAVGVSASLAGWIFNLFWGIVGGVMFLRAKHTAIIQPEAQCA
ncbi:lysylphosphatidylglycerol synthase transmembrane domain-containing protein [Prosthecobacter sp.]|uniref:lysylphosphatidylglycerol synthase transmembrane domain-containing protein n=1 Tax=Prosthecobacter sp. TaxID=1965333 RepID=UPI002489FBA4|nr:lysylphosphatidylglycerol synthase transmembrane domain-containing protein [Prosthecobacter sp.]MDI1315662.1 lysylphosphatidylglycerol synthase transmembrane domain-containing protein [Prosthecobacter sp.]